MLWLYICTYNVCIKEYPVSICIYIVHVWVFFETNSNTGPALQVLNAKISTKSGCQLFFLTQKESVPGQVEKSSSRAAVFRVVRSWSPPSIVDLQIILLFRTPSPPFSFFIVCVAIQRTMRWAPHAADEAASEGIVHGAAGPANSEGGTEKTAEGGGGDVRRALEGGQVG